MRLAVVVVIAGLLGNASPGLAQTDSSTSKIPWERGPILGKLGTEATLNVLDGCIFTEADGTRQFLEETKNPTNGRERATVLCPVVDSAGEAIGEWFVVFEFDPSGYVKDDDKESLDAAAILKSIQQGTEAANEERAKRGWPAFHVVGWARSPYYDTATNNLTWAIAGVGTKDDSSYNHSVRLLGRRGVMSADLVVSPEHYAAALPRFDSLVSTFGYVTGERYAEWTKGDKIAKYGLTALVGGAAGAVLVKTGLLQKFWKLIAVGVVGVLAAIKRLFTGKREATEA